MDQEDEEILDEHGVPLTPEEIRDMERERVLSPIRLMIVVATIIMNVISVISFASMPGSDWRTGLALNIVNNVILIAYAVIFKDRLMGHLLAFGLIVGSVELIADAWIVDQTGTLDYSIGGGPLIWRSPIWMPLAWEVIAVQFAVVGGWLIERFGLLRGILLTGLIGAVNIPFYEEMALKTHWWAYSGCRMFFHTPYYIIMGEFFIVIVFAILFRWLKEKRFKETLVAGILGGTDILICYAGAYAFIESGVSGL